MFRQLHLVLFLASAMSTPALAQRLAPKAGPVGGTSFGPVAPLRYEILEPGPIDHIASNALCHAGPVLAFVADEAANGADLNGDGDALDHLPQVYDGRTRTLTSLDWSLGTSSISIYVGEETVGFVVGSQARLYELATGTLHDLGLIVSESDTAQGNFDRWPHERAFGVQQPSGGVGCLDTVTDLQHSFPSSYLFQLNDRSFFHSDSTLRVFDLDTGIETPIGIYHALRARGGLALLWQWEWLLATDLNGDGDTVDVVTSIRDEAAGTVLATQLAITDRDSNLQPYISPSFVGRFIAFVAWEVAQGVDLNGDGDAYDRVLHLYDSANQSVTNLGLPGGRPDLWNGRLSFVASVYDVDTGTLMHTGIEASNLSRQGSRGQRALTLMETALTGDLNGDGDFSGDKVLHLFDSATLALTNLGLAAENMVMGRRHVAFTAVESQQSHDLNGDGDLLDRVLHLHLFASGQTLNLGIVGQFPSSSSSPDYGDEVGPWVAFLSSAGRPLLVRVY